MERLIAFIIAIALTLISSTHGAAATHKPCLWSDKNGKITDEPYDEASEICCEKSGKHTKINHQGHKIDCCGETTIDTESQVCCVNQTYDSPITQGNDAGKHRICCGSTPHIQHYNYHYCCGENYISKNLGCCAEKPYNRSMSYCKRNTGTVLAIGEGICGSQIYNRSHQKCCGVSTLHNVSAADAQYRCCGSELYNKKTSQCCRPQNIVQNLTGQCCGKGLYNTKTEICCQGNTITSFGVLGCCGGGAYNITDPQAGCCSKGPKTWKAYRKDKEICCDGAVHSVMQTSVTGNLSCCGNQSYSPRQELCCGHETRIVLNKTALDHDQCCPNGPTGQQYGPTGQQYSSCKKGEPVPTEGSSMCGKAPYNQTRDLCCNNEVHRDGTAIGKKCCGSSTWAYFPNNETCCFNQVKPKALGCSGKLPSSKDKTSITLPGSPRTSGICKICSPEWKQPQMVESHIKSQTIDICTKKAIKLKVISVSPNTTTSLFPWTWLNVSYRKNIYKRDGKTTTPGKQSFNLFLPCRCDRLDSMRGRPALLLTNIDFNTQRIFLGDGDLILPLRKNLMNRVQMLSKVCPNNVVKNIYSLLQISPIESRNSK
uniref:Galaxin-like repeats domain-containing protein n=1 Tax=Magallana gigas TaxID=29159 RepID=A0A8W8LTS5_MAGGI